MWYFDRRGRQLALEPLAQRGGQRGAQDLSVRLAALRVLGVGGDGRGSASKSKSFTVSARIWPGRMRL
jgi:hypothetical protein